MKRRSFLVAPLALLLTEQCYGHRIDYKQRGEVCVNRSCSMCQHNDAHKRGLEHKNGQWYDPRKMHQSDVPPINNATKLYDSIPHSVVDELLRIVQPTTSDLLYDLGCGDGRVVIAAARDYGCHSIGIEIDPKRALLAEKNVENAGVRNMVAILTGDVRGRNISYGTIIIMYLFADLISQVVPYAVGARAIVSVNHKMPAIDGLTQVRHKLKSATIYVSS